MDNIPQLIWQLTRGARSGRAAAAIALGESRDARAMKPLIDAFIQHNLSNQFDERYSQYSSQPFNSDWEIRRAAATALKQLRDIGVVEPLLMALTDLDRDVRMVAITLLGKVKEIKVVKSLVSLLADRDNDIRNAAIKALRSISLEISPSLAIFPILTLLSGKYRIAKGVQESVLTRFNQIETVMFISEPLDFSNLSMPMPRLQHILIQADTCDFHQIEYFLTYALNYIGEKYLKRHVTATIYGDPERLNLNVFNALKHLCKQVDILPNETLQW